MPQLTAEKLASQPQHFNGQNQLNDQNLSKVYENKQPRPAENAADIPNNITYHGSHDGAQGDPRKWEMPGWRIEQSYSKKTLIGNWCEERNKVEHGNVAINSSNRADFKEFEENQVPNTQLRRHALRRESDGTRNKYQDNNLNNNYNKLLESVPVVK